MLVKDIVVNNQSLLIPFIFVDYDMQHPEKILEPHITGCLSPTRAEFRWGTEGDSVGARIELLKADIVMIWWNIEFLEK